MTFTMRTAAGVDLVADDDGAGPVVLVVHPGMDDGSSWRGVAELLAPRFRVVRLHRRRYVLPAGDLSMQDEAADVVALARELGGQVLLVGHSSGGVVALEALVADPSPFSGAVLYEPPVHLRGGEWTSSVTRARNQLDAGRPGRALGLFLREIVRIPGWAALLTAVAIPFMPRFRALVPGQISDAAAIDDLGVRLDAYARIRVPTVLVTGTASPRHLQHRVDVLAHTIPGAEVVVLDGRGHAAQTRHPSDLGEVIEAFPPTSR